jgi:hypothetical protein
MATTPTIVVGRNNWGIKNGNLLGYYQSDDGFFVKREFAATRGGGTNGTFVGSNGLIQTAASGNVPRIDFYGGSPALLVEPSGTNLALQSEAFNTTWGRTRINAFGSGSVANTTGTLDPYGTNLADYLQEDTSASDTHRMNQSIAVVSGTTYSMTCFLKSAERFQVGLYVFQGGVERYTIFNLASGTATATSATGGIENYGNGWYRCRTTFTATASGTLSPGIYLCDDSGNLAYTGTGTKGLYAFGFQFETGSVATSYIPTTTGTVTRNADVISLTGATDYIGQTQGTIYCEFAYFGQPVIRSGPIYLRQASLKGLSINSAPGEGIVFISRNDGGNTSLIVVSGALQIGTYYKIAVGYDAGGTAAGGSQASGVVAYVNGTQAAIGTFQVPDAAGLTEFRMYGGNAGIDTEAFNGRIRSAAIYTTRLTNAQLQALTTL